MHLTRTLLTFCVRGSAKRCAISYHHYKCLIVEIHRKSYHCKQLQCTCSAPNFRQKSLIKILNSHVICMHKIMSALHGQTGKNSEINSTTRVGSCTVPLNHSAYAYIAPRYVTTPTRHDYVHAMPRFNLTLSHWWLISWECWCCSLPVMTTYSVRPGLTSQVAELIHYQPGASDGLRLRSRDWINIADTVRSAFSRATLVMIRLLQDQGHRSRTHHLSMLSLLRQAGILIHVCT